MKKIPEHFDMTYPHCYYRLLALLNKFISESIRRVREQKQRPREPISQLPVPVFFHPRLAVDPDKLLVASVPLEEAVRPTAPAT